jgi:DNA polymerase V
MRSALKLYDRIINQGLLVRRINISVNNLISESKRKVLSANEQLDFFTDYKDSEKKKKEAEESYKREKKKQNALLSIKKKYGGNAILRGVSFEEGATGIERNAQIGGHKA